MNKDREEMERRMFLRGGLFLWAAAILLLLWMVVTSGQAAADEGLRARLSFATEVLHGQGYWSPSLRVGWDGGLGVRYSRLTRPMWAREIPESVTATDPRTGRQVTVPLNLGNKWKIESAGLLELDKEWCGQRWCGALGVAYINRDTPMNGTRWNFGLHIRYAIDKNWSLVLDHYSHGSMLGISQDESNRGWNLLGVAYSFGGK